MVKRALTLLTSILIALSLLMPFNIYASGYVVTGSDVVIGVNADIYDYDKSYYSQLVQLRSSGSSQWLADSNIGYQDFGVYRYEFILNKEYLGSIYIKATFPSGTSQTFKFYVNGDRFYWYTRYDPVYNQDMATSFNVTSVSLVEKEDNQMSSADLTNFLNELIANQEELIESSADIYDETVIIGNNTVSMNRVLSEFYQYVSVYQKQSLDTINNYLSFISDLRQWNVPYESYLGLLYPLNKYKPYDLFNISYFNYPLFNLNAGDILTVGHITNSSDFGGCYVILLHQGNSYNITSLQQFIEIQSNSGTAYIKSANQINVGSFNDNSNLSIIKFLVSGSVNEFFKIVIKLPRLYCPLYVGHANNYNLSTDFALQFGLSNKVLDNLDKIANGTNASHSASQSSDSANEQLQTDSNTLFQQENGFKSDMQNAMQNVNNTFRLQDMGTKFVSSAQWVRTQYEQLTNNTPFASLITFSLITGLALILLGKVYK